MIIGQNIKDLCFNQNISVKELAKRINIQDSLLYKYINEKSLPTINNLIKIANYFDCSINFLVGLSDNPKQDNFSDIFDKNEFYLRYASLLLQNNISHYKLCKILDYSMSSLRNWKKGEIPYIDTLYKMASNFDVSIDYLIGRSNTK